MDKLIMEVFVETDKEKTVELENGHGRVKMIPFQGTVKSDLFQGIVEPCGVDTQVTDANQVRHMSARYMLTGVDYAGQSCHIYVENNAWFANDKIPMPFQTIPTFITDSKALAGYLHTSQFRGQGMSDERGLVISFYEMA